MVGGETQDDEEPEQPRDKEGDEEDGCTRGCDSDLARIWEFRVPDLGPVRSTERHLLIEDGAQELTGNWLTPKLRQWMQA